MPIWTPPNSVVPAAGISSTQFNAETVNNLLFLLSGKSLSKVIRRKGSDYILTGAGTNVMADIDSTNLKFTQLVTSGRVRISFSGSFFADSATARQVFFDVTVDGASLDGSPILLASGSPVVVTPIAFTVYKTGLSVGSHTFGLQWKQNTTTNQIDLLSDNTSAVCFSVEEF